MRPTDSSRTGVCTSLRATLCACNYLRMISEVAYLFANVHASTYANVHAGSCADLHQARRWRGSRVLIDGSGIESTPTVSSRCRLQPFRPSLSIRQESTLCRHSGAAERTPGTIRQTDLRTPMLPDGSRSRPPRGRTGMTEERRNQRPLPTPFRPVMTSTRLRVLRPARRTGRRR
jgi:hypothetical protein